MTLLSADTSNDNDEDSTLTLMIIMSFGAVLFVCSACAFIIVKLRNENKGIAKQEENIANVMEDIDQEEEEEKDDDLYKMTELMNQNAKVDHEQTTSSDGAKNGENEGYNKYNRIEQILKAIYEDESDKYLK